MILLRRPAPAAAWLVNWGRRVYRVYGCIIDQHDTQFHIQSIRELCRVAREVRVFPLLTLGGEPSPHVAAVTAALADVGVTMTIERVPYEFQRGGNEMLRLRRGAAAAA